MIENKKAWTVWTGDNQTQFALVRLAWDWINFEVPGCDEWRREEPHP
jgi:hypothetical protein